MLASRVARDLAGEGCGEVMVIEDGKKPVRMG